MPDYSLSPCMHEYCSGCYKEMMAELTDRSSLNTGGISENLQLEVKLMKCPFCMVPADGLMPCVPVSQFPGPSFQSEEEHVIHVVAGDQEKSSSSVSIPRLLPEQGHFRNISDVSAEIMSLGLDDTQATIKISTLPRQESVATNRSRIGHTHHRSMTSLTRSAAFESSDVMADQQIVGGVKLKRRGGLGGRSVSISHVIHIEGDAGEPDQVVNAPPIHFLFQ